MAQRAADFKVPKKLLFMTEIPKGGDRQLQRIGLAQKLGAGLIVLLFHPLGRRPANATGPLPSIQELT